MPINYRNIFLLLGVGSSPALRPPPLSYGIRFCSISYLFFINRCLISSIFLWKFFIPRHLKNVFPWKKLKMKRASHYVGQLFFNILQNELFFLPFFIFVINRRLIVPNLVPFCLFRVRDKPRMDLLKNLISDLLNNLGLKYKLWLCIWYFI